MAHCTKCGAVVADNAAFCASCGSPQSAPGGAPSAAPSAAPAGSAAQAQPMAENVAGLLCYVAGWITGLIFYFVDKRPFVRFHAAQSITVFGGLIVVAIGLAIIHTILFFLGGLFIGILFTAIFWLLYLAGFVLWIVLMIKAYQGERFRVPVAADLSEKIFGKA